MKKYLLAIPFLALFLISGILAETINLDNTQTTCLGTDCEYVETALGTINIDNCGDKLYMDVDLSGLEEGNYQLSIQTYSNDKRLDSTIVCANPNGPMIGHENAWECGSWEDYSFYNFDMDAVTTGTFQESYEIILPEGYYNVILLVKHDKTPDGTGGASYPIVLQKGQITFSVSDSCMSQFQDRLIALENKVAELETTCTCVDGTNGKSAYELWLDEGNTGTVQDFLNSLVGPQGPQGLQGETGYGIPGETGPQGPAGSDGYTPVKGVDYFDGTDGTNATVDLTPIETKVSYFDSVVNSLFKFFPLFDIYYHNPAVEKEDCTTKANDYYCDYRGYSVRKDYYNCKSGYGTATECEVGKCSFITGHKLCDNCNVNTGLCQ